MQRPQPEWVRTSWRNESAFIWHPDECIYYEQPRQSVCAFRHDITLTESPQKACWRVNADTRYRLFINGKAVGRGPLRSDFRHLQYDEWEVSSYLQPGQNSIAVLVLHHGYGTGSQASIRPGLLVDGSIILKSGAEIAVCSNQDWYCRFDQRFARQAPRLNGRLGPIEVWDERLGQSDWATAAPQGPAWVKAACFTSPQQKSNAPFHRLCAPDIPRLESATVSIEAGYWLDNCPMAAPELENIGEQRPVLQAGKYVEDHVLEHIIELSGQQTATVISCQLPEAWYGYPCLELSCTGALCCDVMVTEAYWEERQIIQGHNSRCFVDRWLLDAGDRQKLECQFGGKTGRYLQIWLWGTGTVSFQAIGMQTTRYPFPEQEALSLPQPWPTICKVAEHTLRLCTQDGILDSPSREQQQWMGDGRRQAWTSCLRYGDARPWRRLLNQIRQSQDGMGAMLPRHPGRHENIKPIPMFMLDWIMSLAEYTRWSGDRAFAEDCWLNLLGVIRFMQGFTKDDQLLHDVPMWMYIDWGNTKNPDWFRGGVITALNGAWIGALQAAAWLGDQLQQHDTATACRRWAETADTSLKELCWNAERGAFVDCWVAGQQSTCFSEPSNIQALLHLQLDDQQRADLATAIFADQDDVEGCSPAYVLDLGQALSTCGRLDLALQLLQQRFTTVLDSGTTTLWERWWLFQKRPSGSINMASASHGWGAGILAVFLECATGLEITSTGFTHCRINPQWQALEEFSGTLHAPQGPLTISWSTQADKAELTIPDGITVALPDGRSVTSAGHYSWTLSQSLSTC